MRKKPAARRDPNAWTEVETNQRHPPTAVNRVATYTDVFGISIRFLFVLAQKADRTQAMAPTIALANGPFVQMPAAVAKRLLFDLEAAIKTYEAAFGIVPTLEELDAISAKAQSWHEAEVKA